MENGKKGKVCVTGGTGFIGSWLVKRLLEDGYTVNTTVRPDPEKKRDLSFLKNLPRASEKLQIYTADLNSPESFAPAIEGCTGAFLVANPMDIANETEEVIVKRSIDGALGVLQVCLNSKTVKRVVFTSSVAAVHCIAGDDDGGCGGFGDEAAECVDENCWSNIEYMRSNYSYVSSYLISKTLTEKAVLEFSEETGLEVVTVNPTTAVGPFICPKLPGSVACALALILGIEARYGLLLRTSMVHVDDIARAHIFLLEHPNANGRFLCSSHVTTLQELLKFISAKYPEYQMPSLESLKNVKGMKFIDVSSKKLLESGFEYKYGIDEMFDGAIKSCKEKGFL